jgi:hypothetical protein
VKQRRPVSFIPIGIGFYQAQHRFLYQVQGIFTVTGGQLGDTERTPFDTGKKTVQSGRAF